MSADSPRPRGRPSTVDQLRVNEAALRLWSEHGFAATGWQELAEATGVSVRTLQRHFARREEIAELGIAPATAALRAALARTPAAVPAGEAVCLAVRDSVAHSPDALRLAAPWLRLMMAEPDLVASATRAYAPWIATIATFLQERMPEAPAAACRAVATAYQAAAFAALTEWADAGCPGSPADTVELLLRWIDVRTPSPRRSTTPTPQESP